MEKLNILDKKNIVIAIDIGASSGRLIAGYLEGGVIHMQELFRFENKMIVKDGFYTWNIKELFNNIIRGLSDHNTLKIKSLGVDTWGVDYVLIDKEGKELDDSYSYRDKKNQESYEKALEELGHEYIYYKTGVHFMPFNTLYQLKEQITRSPSLFDDIKHVLLMPDYIHYKLSGVASNEFSILTTTQMLDYNSSKLDNKILEYIGIKDTLFPPMVESGVLLGNITSSVKNMTGLDSDVSVIASAAHDTASAIITFSGEEDTVYINSGTWSVLGVETTHPLVSKKAMDYNFSYEGGAYHSNLLVKNIVGMWIINKIRSEIGSDISFDDITKLVQNSPPFRTIINPNSVVFFNPPNMVHAIQDYAKSTNQEVPKSTPEILRTVYDGIALLYNATLRELEELTKKKYSRINIIGGGSKNKFLNQLTSDVTRCEVFTGHVETSALGNIIVQMISLGLIHDVSEAREIIAKSTEREYYTPAQNTSIHQAIVLFDELYKNDNSI